MADHPIFEWTGASGKTYTYYVWSLSEEPNANQVGNYIFAYKQGQHWYAVYIGEGDLRARRAEHLRNGCVKRKGATHFHCHLQSNERTRLNEEDDLLAGNPEAYEPDGCNDRKGG